jgi:hypothetical protein
VRKLTDVVTHRVEANLEAIRSTLLVDLPADRWAPRPSSVRHPPCPAAGTADRQPCPGSLVDPHPRPRPPPPPPPPPRPLLPPRSFTYEEFNACQTRHQKKVAEALAVRNEEVLRSIEDVIALIRWVGGGLGRGSVGVG